MDFCASTCAIQRQGLKHILKPVHDQKQANSDKPSSVHSLLLNATQVFQTQKQGCARSFMIKVSDSGKNLENPDPYSYEVQQILHEFHEVTKPRGSLPPEQNTAHTIPLEPGHKPPFRPIFRLSPVEMAEVDK
jgi:hypothetical protein